MLTHIEHADGWVWVYKKSENPKSHENNIRNNQTKYRATNDIISMILKELEMYSTSRQRIAGIDNDFFPFYARIEKPGKVMHYNVW